MSELIEFPSSEQALKSLEELTTQANELAKNSENVWMNCPHVQERMRQRNITTRQILDVLRLGKGIHGPTLDKYGDLRIKLKRYTAGRVVQVVVVVKEYHLEVVTVI